jgi:site-specific DNA-cytosine methylase
MPKTNAKKRKAPIKTLDLFSGIGGITLALEGLADPVAYCDVDPVAIACLHENMRKGNLMRAPVCTDVRKLNKGWMIKNKIEMPDMIVGGFPCVGFSMLGVLEGFENEQSGLFSHIMRLVDELQVTSVFLENVPNILRLGMGAVVKELTVKRGFELRWCVLGADDLGAPQTRKRWFCLATRAGFEMGGRAPNMHTFDWRKNKGPTPVERMDCDSSPTNKRESFARLGLLGNSVVPIVVLTAFTYLAKGFKLGFKLGFKSEVEFSTSVPEELKPAEKKESGEFIWPRCGRVVPTVTRRGRWEYDVANEREPSKLEELARHRRKYGNVEVLRIMPRVYVSDKPPSIQLTKAVLEKETVMNKWSTPRHSNTASSNYLTERTKRDLGTQVRFEINTPDSMRGCHVNPEFVEWIMGFPRGWTEVTGAP